MARKGAMKWNSHSVFATPKHLAFRLPPKNTVSQNCYLLSVICNAKNRFWKLLYCYIVTLGVNWRCPRNRNSPRETYFSIPKTVILQAVRIESHDVNDLSLWHLRVQKRYKEYDGCYLGHYAQYFFWFFFVLGFSLFIYGMVIIVGKWLNWF